MVSTKSILKLLRRPNSTAIGFFLILASAGIIPYSAFGEDICRKWKEGNTTYIEYCPDGYLCIPGTKCKLDPKLSKHLNDFKNLLGEMAKESLRKAEQYGLQEKVYSQVTRQYGRTNPTSHQRPCNTGTQDIVPCINVPRGPQMNTYYPRSNGLGYQELRGQISDKSNATAAPEPRRFGSNARVVWNHKPTSYRHPIDPAALYHQAAQLCQTAIASDRENCVRDSKVTILLRDDAAIRERCGEAKDFDLIYCVDVLYVYGPNGKPPLTDSPRLDQIKSGQLPPD